MQGTDREEGPDAESQDRDLLLRYSLPLPRESSMIRIGALQPGARPVGIGVTGARRGVALFTDGSIAGVIVKSGSQHELAAECFCALLAQRMGLKAPDCGLVTENGVWHFASIDARHPNLLQAFNFQALPPNLQTVVLGIVAAQLAKWTGVGQLLAFDVLVKNADRNPGNLLTDGTDYWLIDHARTMDAFVYSNVHKVFEIMKGTLSAADQLLVRQKAVGASLTYGPGCHTLSLAEIAAKPVVSPFAPQFDALIAARLTNLSTTVNSTL